MTKLAIVLAQGFADWECAHLMAAATEHFGFECVVATPGAEEVRSMGGLRVIPDVAVENLDPSDYAGIVVCGGTSWERGAAPDLDHVLIAFSTAGRLVAGICAATLALAKAGLLDGVAHTSNAPQFLETVETYRGRELYLESGHAVTAGNIVTAPGTAAVTFMAEVLRALGIGGEEFDAYIAMLGREHHRADASN